MSGYSFSPLTPSDQIIIVIAGLRFKALLNVFTTVLGEQIPALWKDVQKWLHLIRCRF